MYMCMAVGREREIHVESLYVCMHGEKEQRVEEGKSAMIRVRPTRERGKEVAGERRERDLAVSENNTRKDCLDAYTK